eukprot:TRINITY_DN1679_c0_g1_i3.p1 TRINITY_DN1679_c0_g1~~TRINITY_DN1679_c0_g1_i3.p1  ORF type:complete len:490 (-),score=101.08 TRINITY_DN1679_c0_g1_i3:265-1734(-)
MATSSLTPDERSLEEELQSKTKEELISLILDSKKRKVPLLSEDSEGIQQHKPQQTASSSEKQTMGAKKKQPAMREFDMSRYKRRHVALKVAYIGWDYHGLASQVDSENTIEYHLFAALKKTCLITAIDESNYSRCGRTDKGVSAFGQVIALYLRSNLTEGEGIIDESKTENNDINNNNNNDSNETAKSDGIVVESDSGPSSKKINVKNQNQKKSKPQNEIDYAYVLNRVLPPEIRVIAWTPVKMDFSARFSCLYRTYKYFFVLNGMDIGAMLNAGKRFLGEHDFRNFCKIDAENVSNFRRTMLNFEIQPTLDLQNGGNKDLYCFTITGYAFLWHQIRCMVAVLFLVGRRLETPDIIDYLLDVEKNPQKPRYDMASELPLVLYDCGFEGLNWRYELTHTKLVTHFQEYTQQLTLKNGVVGLMLSSVESVKVEQNSNTESSSKDNKERHVKLCDRPREDSLEEKQKRVNEKRQKLGIEMPAKKHKANEMDE